MSRVGKKPIDVPAGVTVAVAGARVTVKGPKGELVVDLPECLTAAAEGKTLTVGRRDETRGTRGRHGLFRTMLANAADGVRTGYRRELEIQGVGFKAELQGRVLTLSLGFSSPKRYEVPSEVQVAVEGGTKVLVSGIDKQKVGEVAARIRAFRPAEPYKGKGVRYGGERVRRKVGKTVA